MAYDAVRRGKLSFKGSSSAYGPTARTAACLQLIAYGANAHVRLCPRTTLSLAARPKPATGTKAAGGAAKRKAEEPAEPTDGWVRVTEIADLSGPVFVCTNGSEKCVSVTEDGRIRLVPVPPSKEPEQVGVYLRTHGRHIQRQWLTRLHALHVSLRARSLDQVLVAHSILPGVITLKSAYNNYLAADKFGILNATSEAIGPQQEWTPIFRPEGVVFQSKYEKFLKFEDDRNSLRADSESSGFCEIFHVYCQAARRAEMRKKANQKAAASKPVTEVEIEAAYAMPARGHVSQPCHRTNSIAVL